MKKITILAFLILYELTACNTDSNKVTINGKISSEPPFKIQYTVPIEGISYFGFSETVQPDSSGNFKIVLDIDKPSVIELFQGFKAYGSVIAEPGMNYSVTIKGEAGKCEFKVEGKNGQGQELYNSLKNRSMIAGGHFELEAREFYKDSVVNHIEQSLNDRKEKEIAGFRDLFEKNIISKDFLNLVATDREYFYSGASGSVAFINFILEPNGRNALSEKQYSELWKKVVKDKPATASDLISSPWFFYYVQNYLRYEEFIVDSTDVKSIGELRNKGMINTHNIEYAGKFLSSPFLEYYYAAYIYYEAINKNYEKELISLFDKFKQDYPKSNYTKYLVPLIDEIIAFHKKAEEEFSKKSLFVDNYENLNSLSECLKSFAGKKVYVDVWATWCSPCKAEFAHKEELRKLLQSENIELLYISIDKDEDTGQWKDVIKFYNLEGYHVKANQLLNADLVKIFDQNGSISIPWYMLIDEKGNIKIKRAEAPSQIDKLRKQIR
jgi:thiol-disulfide isomerase/thioredoxin